MSATEPSTAERRSVLNVCLDEGSRACFKPGSPHIHWTCEWQLLLDNGAASARAAVGEVAGASPTRPEDQREQGADDADDEQDVADRVQVEAGGGHVDRPGENGAGGDQDEANSQSHKFLR